MEIESSILYCDRPQIKPPQEFAVKIVTYEG